MWSKRHMWACRSRAIFNDPSLEDLGTFSCVVTNTDGMSSSYTLTEEGRSGLLHLLVLLQILVLEESRAERQDVHFHCYRLYPTGLNRLLDISHDKKFPGQYPTALLLCKVYGKHCVYAVW